MIILQVFNSSRVATMVLFPIYKWNYLLLIFHLINLIIQILNLHMLRASHVNGVFLISLNKT